MRGTRFMLVTPLQLSRSRALILGSTRLAPHKRILTMSSAPAKEMEESVRLVSPAKNERIGKVLMLHGWAQNAWAFQSKSKGLTKKLNQAGYDCVFLEGPHVLPMTSTIQIEGTPVEVENGKRENARAWFLLSQEDPADATLSQSETPMEYIGLDDSLKILKKELEGDNQYCAVFGFSQGGLFAHILSVLAMQDSGTAFQRIKCAIIASGFAAQHESNQDSPFRLCQLASLKIALPSLHIIGEKDVSVRPELSMKLVNLFEESQVMKHDKGHILPQKSAQCAEIISFLNRNLPVSSP